jgi:hypothetical protein
MNTPTRADVRHLWRLERAGYAPAHARPSWLERLWVRWFG